MFLVNATAGVPLVLILLSLLASFLVRERYSSITSGTRRTAFNPTRDFGGVGGGGAAAVVALTMAAVSFLPHFCAKEEEDWKQALVEVVLLLALAMAALLLLSHFCVKEEEGWKKALVEVVVLLLICP